MSEPTTPKRKGWLGGALAALAAVVVIPITCWMAEFFLFWKWLTRSQG